MTDAERRQAVHEGIVSRMSPEQRQRYETNQAKRAEAASKGMGGVRAVERELVREREQAARERAQRAVAEFRRTMTRAVTG